jgi:Kef-type K+ transport system membrane component KefB
VSLSGVPTLALSLVVIVVAARLLGLLLHRLGQPTVIGEMLAGILLGPTLFSGAVTQTLFPSQVMPALGTLSDLGVAVFIFLVGLEYDRRLLRSQGRITISVALGAIVVPFGLGVLVAVAAFGHHASGDRPAFVLFLGTAMAVTAFPVLARILIDRQLLHTPIGGLALACASLDDVLAWALLAVVAALAGGGTQPWLVLLVLPLAALLQLVARPLLERLAARPARPAGPLVGGLTGAAVVVALGAGLWLSAWATAAMGLHLIFGAFLFGVAMPRDGAIALRERVLPWIQRISSVLLLPVFFTIAGLKVDLSTLDSIALGELALILLVAVGGKCVGAVVGARLHGVDIRRSAVLAVLLNTRGLTELIVLAVGLQLGVLDDQLYSLMVVMALVTTTMTGLLLPLMYPQRQVVADRLAASCPHARPLWYSKSTWR